MEPKEPMEPKKPSTETEMERIRRQMVGQEITLEEYEKAVAEGLENFPEDYISIKNPYPWERNGLDHIYYKVPKVSNEELQTIIADRTRQAAEEAARHTRHIKYIIITLIILGIIGSFILSHNIAEALDNLRTYSYYY